MMPKITLLADGKKAYDRIFYNIAHAKRTIEISMFIWRDDGLGETMAERLLDAANRGVLVTIRKDKLGWAFERAEENNSSMLHNGRKSLLLIAKYCAINSLYGSRGITPAKKSNTAFLLSSHKNIKITTQIENDHSKYYIFDDKIIITGGMNIEQKHITEDIQGRAWRDYMLEIRGEKTVDLLKDRLLLKADFGTNNGFDFITNDAKTGRYEMKKTILETLGSARTSVDIEMAYIGYNDVTRKLIDLSHNNITVSIMIPARANLQDDTNKRIAAKLIAKSNGKIKIMLCKDMLHAKALVIDKRIAIIGSANLNHQALEKIGELDVYSKDKKLVDALCKSFETHKKSATMIDSISQIKYSKITAWLESFVC